MLSGKSLLSLSIILVVFICRSTAMLPQHEQNKYERAKQKNRLRGYQPRPAPFTPLECIEDSSAEDMETSPSTHNETGQSTLNTRYINPRVQINLGNYSITMEADENSQQSVGQAPVIGKIISVRKKQPGTNFQPDLFVEYEGLDAKGVGVNAIRYKDGEISCISKDSKGNQRGLPTTWYTTLKEMHDNQNQKTSNN